MAAPLIIALAGPNGAGKSTSGPALLNETLGVRQVVNADVIAQGLSGFAPESVAVTAGRIMLERLRHLAAAEETFAFETTLAGRAYAPWIRGLVRRGYRFHLVFLWLPTPELAIERVADRVRRGGHSIPEATIRRRHEAGLANFFHLYRPLGWWHLYDGSGPRPRLIAAGRGLATTRVDDEGAWLRLSSRYRLPTLLGERADDAEVEDLLALTDRISEALRRAVRQALLEHKREGLPIVIWRDGRVVWVPPQEIEMPEE